MPGKKLLTVIFSASCFLCVAQKKDSIRNLNIDSFNEYFFFYTVTKQRYSSFEFSKRTNPKRTVKFQPNNYPYFGFGGYLFEVGFELTFAVPVNDQQKYLYGTSSATDYQVNLLSKNWGADAYYADYQGFYAEDSGNPLTKSQPREQRPDVRTHNLGANGIYVFNRNKFSLPSAYNFGERQLKSAGSIILTTTLNEYSLKADSAILSGSYQPIFGAIGDLKEFQSGTFSIAPGYTYSLVVKNFFINATLAFGPAQHWVDYTYSNGDAFHSSRVNSFSDARIAIGYNGQRIFGGINFVNQSRHFNFDDTQFTSSSNTFRMVLGYRFREVGILKKRALDYLPKFLRG